jgi:large subunit ribosomal protein L10
LNPVKRAEKENIVEELKEKFERSDVAVLTRFVGLKVPEINQLRDECKKIAVDYHVVKNTLVRRAMQGTAVARLEDRIEGPIAIALAQKDIVPVAKLLVDYVKTHPPLRIHAGLVQERVLDGKAVEQIATLPSREELLAKLLFLMNAPLIQLMNVMTGVQSKLVRVLAAIQQQKENQG